MRNARRKLEIPMPAAMSCKTPINSRGETCRSIGKRKTKYACIVDADECTRPRLAGAGHKPHQDHVIAKGTNSLTHEKSCAQIHSDVSSIQNSRGKGGSGKIISKTGENPAWQVTKVRNKKEVINEARTKGRKVHFASLMNLCHLKNSELNLSIKSTKAELYSEGTLWKIDSASYAVFTDQGSSASQMTAAKIIDTMSRLPGCAGQAADAVSAYTQVKMEDAPTLLKIPKSEGPDIWIRLPKHDWPKSWSSMEDPGCSSWKESAFW